MGVGYGGKIFFFRVHLGACIRGGGGVGGGKITKPPKNFFFGFCLGVLRGVLGVV